MGLHRTDFSAVHFTCICHKKEVMSKSQVCANVFCGAGRECTVTEKAEPVCLCIEQCKPHKRTVCGSNGKTYHNHCELHRDACLTGLKIQVARDGRCQGVSSREMVCVKDVAVIWLRCVCGVAGAAQRGCALNAAPEILRVPYPEKKIDKGKASPTSSHLPARREPIPVFYHLFSSLCAVVCYLGDRNELRGRIIQWLQAEVVPDGWFSKGSNFSDILLKYFKEYDNGDLQLDSSEFLRFIQHNETAINITSFADEESNRLLRNLCVDALIELSDENADWKLSFSEFLNCLMPGFNPPEKKCALEDETYEDGAVTQVECNRCVCACGNWVCTAMTCDGKEKVAMELEEGVDLEMTEEEWTNRVAELNKYQAHMDAHEGSEHGENVLDLSRLDLDKLSVETVSEERRKETRVLYLTFNRLVVLP
ncbi:follistatin-related protein 1-like, partial [Scleropages formosus]